ncbi:MAG TPA: DUF459 domain-containing protein [Frankiaceae bacterium]|nr:DUF459 domain-containing protein [Frankiaceae bacterium]
MTDLRPDARPRHMRDTGRAMEPPRTVDDLDNVVSDDREPITAPIKDDAPAPAPPEGTGGRGRRKRPIAVPRALPAGHAIIVVVGALLFAMLFNSRAMVHAGEGMPAGTTRDLVLDVAKPVNSFAHALYLDRPRKWLDSLFGHKPAPTGPSALSQLPSQADNRPLGSGGKPSTPVPSASAKAKVVAPPKPVVPKLRVPTKAAPLKVLVAGDSMTEFFGPDLINQASAAGKATGNTVTKYGTGLVRPDFFDWSLFAQQLVSQQNPEAVIVMMGGNDGQGITLANGTVLPDGSDAWAKEYRRRVEVVMRIFSGNGKRKVYWVPMPVPRSAKLAIDYHLMDLAVADAAAVVPGVTDVNIVPRLSNNGQYADYLPGLNGQTILARTQDGIHLSTDGANLAATLVLTAMNKDWHLTP